MPFVPPESQALAKVNGSANEYHNAITYYKWGRKLQQPDPSSVFREKAKQIKQGLMDAGVMENVVSMVFASTLQRQNLTGPIVDHLTAAGANRDVVEQVLGGIAVATTVRSLRLLFRHRGFPLPAASLLRDLHKALREHRRAVDMAMLDILEKE